MVYIGLDYTSRPQFPCSVWARGSGVQLPIRVPGLHLGCIFTKKASASSGLIQNLEPKWQLFGKASIFNEDFGSSMPSLSLTLNIEPVNRYPTASRHITQ